MDDDSGDGGDLIVERVVIVGVGVLFLSVAVASGPLSGLDLTTDPERGVPGEGSITFGDIDISGEEFYVIVDETGQAYLRVPKIDIPIEDIEGRPLLDVKIQSTNDTNASFWDVNTLVLGEGSKGTLTIADERQKISNWSEDERFALDVEVVAVETDGKRVVYRDRIVVTQVERRRVSSDDG